jgi:hypothetical protein
VVDNALLLVLEGCSVRIPAGTEAILNEALCGFIQYVHTGTGIVLRLGHNSFLLNPFQFITHQSSYSSMLCSLSY